MWAAGVPDQLALHFPLTHNSHILSLVLRGEALAPGAGHHPALGERIGSPWFSYMFTAAPGEAFAKYTCLT